MESAHLKNKFNAYDSDMYSQYDYHLDGAKEDPEEILRQALRSSYSRRASVNTIIHIKLFKHRYLKKKKLYLCFSNRCPPKLRRVFHYHLPQHQ